MSQEMFHTCNLKVATALVTLGFDMLKPPVTRTVRDDGKDSTVFWFEPRNSEGVSAVEVLRSCTKGFDDLVRQDPEKELVASLNERQMQLLRKVIIIYLTCHGLNRDEMVWLIKNTPRFVEVVRNGRRAAIREDSNEETRRKISNLL
jgi:hypothetical protein